MLLVMYAAEGVGLAAPQVGINKRLMVFNQDGDPASKHNEMVLVNPVIVAKSNKTIVNEEGCLSFPKIYGDVTRARWIAVDYQTLEGKQVKNYYFEGTNAIIFQHEYDHLDKVGAIYKNCAVSFRFADLIRIDPCFYRFSLLIVLARKIESKYHANSIS